MRVKRNLRLSAGIATGMAATLMGAAGPAPASHAPVGTKLWANPSSTGSASLRTFDIGLDSVGPVCTPAQTGIGRGIAHDPVSGELWYSFLGTGSVGDGLIHRTPIPPTCSPSSAINFADGPGGPIQDDIGAIDVDPDDADLWVAGYRPLGNQSYLYKLDRATGALLQSCWVPRADLGFGGNDTLAVARLPGLGGSGKYLLTDAGEPTTNPNALLVVDAGTCTGGSPGTIATSYPKVVPMSGIDFENGAFIAVDAAGGMTGSVIYRLGPFGSNPFGIVTATMGSGVPFLEDVTLHTRLVCSNPSIVGTPGSDFIVGTPGPDVIDSGAGDDIVEGLGGDDVICLGAGNDRGSGSGGNDILVGGPGSDGVMGGAGSDYVIGGPGSDLVGGGAFDGGVVDYVDGGLPVGGDFCSPEAPDVLMPSPSCP